jgi:Tfp pilus tip-associated adhesin PilY1
MEGNTTMKKTSRLFKTLLMLAPVLFAGALMADETDIYFAQTTTANPNILFVLDNSGSMNCTDPSTGAVIPSCLSGGKTRMQVLQESFATVMDAVPSNLNIGLMRYGGHTSNNANGVSFPVKPVDLDADKNGSAWDIIKAAIDPGLDNLPNPSAKQPVRTFLQDVANDWSAEGYTPIVDSLYEAARYYRGESVLSGRLLPDNVRAAHPATYTGSLAADPAACSAPTECVQEWGTCYETIVPGSCHTQNVDECVNWGIVDYNGCCWVSTGVDEAGNATGGYCSSYSCPNWGCLGGSVSVPRTVCQQYTCDEETVTGTATYKSPIEYECQSNYIVLMSDGKPEYQGTGGASGTDVFPRYVDDVKALVGGSCANAPNGYNSGTCGPELTKYLLEYDQASSVTGNQYIQTFTIGFGLDDVNATNYLKALASASGGAVAANDEESLKLAFKDVIKQIQAGASPKQQLAGEATSQMLASNSRLPSLAGGAKNEKQAAGAASASSLAVGGLDKDQRRLLSTLFNPLMYWRTLAAGGFFEATDTESLIKAFSSIINQVTASASSFSSPTYEVDQKTLLANSEYVYIPVFDRNNLPLWPGNLKKFKRDSDGKLIGKNGLEAVNEKGVFQPTAQDFWSNTVDGVDVTSGGAANKLPLPDNRKLFTHTSDVTTAPPMALLNSTNVTPDMLGLAATDTATRNALVDFIRGKKADGTPRYHMGDMLNGKPQIISYGMGSYILAASNEGYLHAIDTNTGIEQWAFMPKSLLKNVKTFYDNNLPKTHVSGIDGGMNIWRFQYDSDGDGKLTATDLYKTYVYFGLRQGGSEYYMLDITNILSPSIVWHISNATTGFAELGQAWSKPALAKMRLPVDASGNISTTENTTTHKSDLFDVLVFGGGYDPVKNNENTTSPAYTRPADSKGRDVFIVEAKTGKLLWSLRVNVSGAAAKLKDSIPGDIRVLDMDRNGALDRLYFADTGGNVWRVDMDVDVKDGLPSSPNDTFYNYTKARFSQFADLGGSGVNKRMFFYEPDVALFEANGKTVMTLAIGSGYRTRPLNQGDDRFYVMIDRNPYNDPDTSIFPIKEDTKLVSITKADGTDNTTQIGGSKTLLTETTLSGWYYDLSTGEKVLAPATTVLGKAVFTTFSSEAGTSTDPCAAPPNSAYAYVVDLLSGAAVADLDRSGDGVNERSVVAGVNEILDAAQVVFRAPSDASGNACTGANNCNSQFVEVRVGKMSLPLVDKTNTANANVDIGDVMPRTFWRELLPGGE